MSTSTKRKYLPRFEGPIEGYVKNYLAKHYWKVASSMEHDDCMQEAFLVFLRCAEKYGVMDSPQHFMALFKTAWIRHYTDMAYKDSAAREVLSYGHQVESEEDGVHDLLDLVPGDLDTDGYLSRLLAAAPHDVATVLSFFLSAPPQLIQAVGEAWAAKGRKHKDGNKMLCQALGFPRGSDLIGSVERYLLH